MKRRTDGQHTESVIQIAPSMGGKFQWRLIGAAGYTIAAGSGHHNSRAGARMSIGRVRGIIVTARVEDVDADGLRIALGAKKC